MLDKRQLKQERKLVNEIDWEMTPERAVAMYLEWGTGWKDNDDVVSSPGDESIYFVIYDWEEKPGVTLIRRTLQGAEEIAWLPVPQDLFEESCREDGKRPGGTVHPPNAQLKQWLADYLGGPPLDMSIN
jgi:hypothetical protein